MAKRTLEPYRCLFPTPATLVTSVSPEGLVNVAASAETYMVSLKPAMIATSWRPETFTNRLIAATGEFVANFPSAAILRAVDICGSYSGREFDKFALTGLTAAPSSRVRPPLVAECPVSAECRVIRRERFGSHDVFVGEVLCVHVEEEALGPDGRPDATRFPAVAVCGHDYFLVGERLGRLNHTGSARSAVEAEAQRRGARRGRSGDAGGVG